MNQPSDKLVVLDLDETLVHAADARLPVKEDFQFDKYFVYKRPGLDIFLQRLSAHFRLGIWSSADDEYVKQIVDSITPADVAFEMVWGRSRCSFKRDFTYDVYYFEKRLDKLKKKGFRLEHILLVDDTPEKARNNYGNAIYLTPFTGDPEDDELEPLFTYLLTLKEVENVRTIEKRNWRTGAGSKS